MIGLKSRQFRLNLLEWDFFSDQKVKSDDIEPFKASDFFHVVLRKKGVQSGFYNLCLDLSILDSHLFLIVFFQSGVSALRFLHSFSKLRHN